MNFGRNLLPYAIVYDVDAGVSTFIDRLFRPIVCAPGRWPRTKMELAIVVDGPPLYGAKLAYQFFGEHAQPSADPIVRRRLRSLIDSCGVLKTELRRRAEDDTPPTTTAREHADLIARTFSEAAA